MNDNNAPERIAIKKNSVVNSERKYKYIYISEYVLLHYGFDDRDHAQYLIHASLHAL